VLSSQLPPAPNALKKAVIVSAPMAKENMTTAPAVVVNCAVVYTKCKTQMPATVVHGPTAENIVVRHRRNNYGKLTSDIRGLYFAKLRAGFCLRFRFRLGSSLDE